MKKPDDDDKEAAAWIALLVAALGVLMSGSLLVRHAKGDAAGQELVTRPRA